MSIMLIPILIFLLMPSIILSTDYIEYSPGDFPVIICSPHDGHLKPSEFSNRVEEGCKIDRVCKFPRPSNCPTNDHCNAVNKSDTNTQPIAREIYAKIVELKNVRPHLLINNLHRTKMDPNAEIDVGAQGDSHAEDAWNLYHNYAQQAHDHINAGGPGLLVDIHGTVDKPYRTELGYKITSSQLNHGTGQVKDSSMRALGERMGLSFDDLMTGPNSFGAFMQNSGFAAVPSPDIPYPGSDHYFTGGYTTGRYGSKYGGQVDAVQAEIGWDVRGDEDVRMAFSAAVAQDIIAFMEMFYGQ